MYFSPVTDFNSKIDGWLNRLEKLQAQANDLGFIAGSIPSTRKYPLSGIVRNDPNVFFPSLIAAKLLEWRHVLSPGHQSQAAAIAERIVATFPLYKSRRGRMHYNFWPTQPDTAFPLGRVLHRFDFFRLPDDIDDTALVYRAMSADKETVEALQASIEQHFQQHYAGKPRVYATWLGDKMPWVTDVCAMVNLLSLFKIHSLPPSAYSHESDVFLEQVILEKRYQKAPYSVSPYYPDTAVISYHLANWAAKSGGGLRNVLAKDVIELYKSERNSSRAMIYEICLMKLGVQVSTIAKKALNQQELVFPWFFGSMLSAVRSPGLRRLGKYRLFHIAHSCEAWSITLHLERFLLERHMID